MLLYESTSPHVTYFVFLRNERSWRLSSLNLNWYTRRTDQIMIIEIVVRTHVHILYVQAVQITADHFRASASCCASLTFHGADLQDLNDM